jgi:NAD(P)H-flavin reductase
MQTTEPALPPTACSSQPLLPQVARVRKKRRETADVTTLWIDAPPLPLDPEAAPAPQAQASGRAWLEQARRPDYAPGQFNMLYAFGVGEAAISIAGYTPGSRLSDSPGTVMHTIRSVGKVTQALTELPVGARLGVRGPFGTPWPLDTAVGHDLIVVGGGIGLAPLRPLVRAVLARRTRYGRVWILHGARTPRDLLFGHEHGRWASSPGVEVITTVDHADSSWEGSVGVVTRCIEQLGAQVVPARTLAMLCGPEVMIRFAARSLQQLGLSEERILVSLERGMACAVGWCGHCQLGPYFVCRDGPVFAYPAVAPWLAIREV